MCWKTICQKCFSESVNSLSICCNNYTSDASPITLQLRDLLYPEYVKKRQENNKKNESLDIKTSIDYIDEEDSSIKNFPSIKTMIGMKELLKILESSVCRWIFMDLY